MFDVTFFQDTRDITLGQHGYPGIIIQDVLRHFHHEAGDLLQLQLDQEGVSELSCHVKGRRVIW